MSLGASHVPPYALHLLFTAGITQHLQAACLRGHLVAHKRLVGRARTYWQGLIHHMVFTSTAWFRGIHPSATLTKNNRQSPNILIVHLGEKQPQNGYKRKNMYGYSWPNMCFVWSVILPRKMWHLAKKPQHTKKHTESSIMRWRKWSRVFLTM